MCIELRLPTRTQAYNTLKGFLGIPKNAKLYVKFFLFFYTPTPDGYVENMPEEKMEGIIKDNGIPKLVRQHHEAPEDGEERKRISQEVFARLRGETSVSKNRAEQPYFVRQ